MKRAAVGIVVMALVALGLVFNATAATPDDAKAFAEKAYAFYKANGKEKAVAEFNNPKGQFVKGDLYVVLQDFTGTLLANGGNPKLAGQNHFDLKDPSGKLFVQEMVAVAKKGGGWFTYTWTNPVTKKVQPKKVWVIRVEGADMFINAGAFQ